MLSSVFLLHIYAMHICATVRPYRPAFSSRSKEPRLHGQASKSSRIADLIHGGAGDCLLTLQKRSH